MPFDCTAPLSERALTTLRAYFNERDHHPSGDHWAALQDIAGTIEAMADNTVERKVHLSSCDPGAGKTQTVVHTLRALVADPHDSDVGVVICVGRKVEATTLASDLKLRAGTLAIATSETAVNQHGNTGNCSTNLQERDDINDTQVLIVDSATNGVGHRGSVVR